MDKVDVLGVDFDNKSFHQFQNEFIGRINVHQSTFVVTANPEIVLAANENPEFMKILNYDADYITPDGIGIIKAANILGTPLKERVTGYDLFTWLMKLANDRSLRVYLIGAKPNVIHAIQAKIAHEYSDIQLVGAEDGYFKEDLEVIAYQIERAEPDLVFAALGSPRQEQLLALLRRNLLPALMMGVGGSFDVFSGMVKRAPQLWQRAHLEWFYRLLKEPSRFKRVSKLPRFMLDVHQAKKEKK
ncbi:WecB/TagA/CpsF family glycosyltransferase [Lactobacillus panisapium]|uniref:N-acetylglucosaminyldiphosphoundecaprenol N-acetyl-beta-D-mannosaminyltransferase n=1 Tax=Lactobacillus panisapium TaxID=2012495 RepID=A0ABX8W861_9LACO|nr:MULTISPECIES: WecB/TagA/CpsF family glycosyltransferase [Lactobacillus]MCT6807627.1 WecB/TagA/CpsF family glycosyltransferase [Bombilactobacillus sp.]MCO6532405.1 WecB/TagA/CpsF family glycosyltransferase [Lactobacillus sp.]MCO6533224.1 WecB/TagA/CpsF family glycosyltransferase [Lactobacillus sp.]MCO6535971.1 WecB/TagA/CpsF family glycosyltransferase [Lactobacillus sp.]MCT6820972.1 WecB/TagA/CpsF family glycosyltransferase [Lactobacillus panisapium]